MQKLVIYKHGKDSISWGEKAMALAEINIRRNYATLLRPTGNAGYELPSVFYDP